MVTLSSSTLPAAPTTAVVVLDPTDPALVHTSGGCADLSALVDLIERTTGAPVGCADAFDAALAELGLVVALDAALGLTACGSCWSAS